MSRIVNHVDNKNLSFHVRSGGLPCQEQHFTNPAVSNLASARYSAAICPHGGRWERLPGTGSLEEVPGVNVTLLQSDLQPHN